MEDAASTIWRLPSVRDICIHNAHMLPSCLRTDGMRDLADRPTDFVPSTNNVNIELGSNDTVGDSYSLSEQMKFQHGQ